MTPIEFDLPRIQDALRTLATMRARYAYSFAPAGTEIGRLIANPIGEAAGTAYGKLYAYLVAAIGQEQANAITVEIEADALRKEAPKPAADEATH